MNLPNGYHERFALFQETFTEEETDTFFRSMSVVGEIIEAGFGADQASVAMSSLYELLTGSKSSDGNWRDAFQDLTVSAEINFTPAMERGADLNAFAFHGILPSWKLPEPLPAELEMSRTDLAAYIQSIIADYERFMGLFGASAPTWGFDVISRTILAARGRLKVDQEAPMTVHELAALSRVAPKRVQNAIYAGSDQSPVVDANGLVTPSSARRWLDDRGYLPTLKLASLAGSDEEVGSSEDELPDEEDDFLFVPEASDGSLFTPSACARGSGDEERFTIGAKGSERTICGYDKALAELGRMVTPRWRRPNSSGNWGVVRAERWRRIRRSDLERL
jgi:hypothetical protein